MYSFRELEFHDRVSIANAPIRQNKANTKLTYLRWTSENWDECWGDYIPQIFNAIGEHKHLRTFALWFYPSREDPTYSWLKPLLSRSRNIALLDKNGERYSNGSSIDRLCALNRFYHGSIPLMNESRLLRPLLVAMALLESVSEKFQHTALLLANHTDALCDSMHSVSFEEFCCCASGGSGG